MPDKEGETMKIDQDELRAAKMKLTRDIFVYVMSYISASGMSHATVAKRLGIKTRDLRKMLVNHSNWSLDTISDLLLAVGAEIDVVVAKKWREPDE